jgi:hypothetical protein
MDRNSISDRLPFGRIPGLGADTDETATGPAGDTADAESVVETDSPADAETGSPVEIDLDEPEDTPSRRDKVRKVLLGVSLGGLGLALLAALLRRVLGGSDDEDGDDEDGDDDFTDGADDVSTDDAESESLSEAFETTESDTEPPADDVASELLTADAEGVAALIGLGFQLLVRALVGEDESESSTA